MSCQLSLFAVPVPGADGREQLEVELWLTRRGGALELELEGLDLVVQPDSGPSFRVPLVPLGAEQLGFRASLELSLGLGSCPLRVELLDQQGALLRLPWHYELAQGAARSRQGSGAPPLACWLGEGGRWELGLELRGPVPGLRALRVLASPEQGPPVQVTVMPRDCRLGLQGRIPAPQLLCRERVEAQLTLVAGGGRAWEPLSGAFDFGCLYLDREPLSTPRRAPAAGFPSSAGSPR